jgi:hypothetical protein
VSGGIDLERLVKLMRMTESTHDGESLNALRLANKMLGAAGKHWGDVLGAPREDRSHLTRPSQRPGTKPGFNKKPTGSKYGARDPSSARQYNGSKGRNYEPAIGDMLVTLSQRNHTEGFAMFLESITEQWSAKGYLTDNQYEVVKRALHRGRADF